MENIDDISYEKMILNNDQSINKRDGISNTKYKSQIAWRRNKVRELLTRGYTQYEISRELHMSQSTVSRDINYLEKDLEKSKRDYGHRLFSTYESTLSGYDEIIKKLWSIIDSKRTDDKEKIKSINLLGQYYQNRMNLIKSELDIAKTKQYMEKFQFNNALYD